jgi:hypothetical protein
LEGLSCSGVAKLGCGGASRERDCLSVVRHPEVAAQRPSKETARAPRPSPFEARSARTSG